MRLLPLLLLLLVACDRNAPSRPLGPEVPPSGRGRYTDDQGEDHTLFRPLGIIAYGEERAGSVPDPRVLLGYEFEGRAGDRPVISLTLPKGRRGGLALYGPRGTDGLWDTALASVNGEGALAIANTTLDVPGMYFILVRSLGEGELGYTLRLRCEGETCAPAACPAIEACDRVCALGFTHDDEGCRLCVCEAAACDAQSCPDGERCVEGRCQGIPCAEQCPAGQEPVCGADGQTWRNPCTAECAGVEVVSRGPCAPMDECDPQRPCTGGNVCRAGRCVADDCGCEPLRAPVCSDQGETFPNRCLLECRQATFAYPGRCLEASCRTADNCGADQVCEPVPDPENRRRCQANPDSLECVRACVPADGEPCGRGGPLCGAAQCLLVGGPDRPGLCTERCDPGVGCPQPDLSCVTLPDRPEVGVCLPTCDPRQPRCPDGLFCGAAADGTFACQAFACGCPQPQPGEAVCADGHDLPSACVARCVGARMIEPGACRVEPGACMCPEGDRRPLVCGADGTLYADACDARCAEQPAARPNVCLGATPLTCLEDADCQATGCDGSVCAAAPSEACPAYSPAAACRVELGPCGCYRPAGQPMGTCSFQLTREAFACMQAAHTMPPPPP